MSGDRSSSSSDYRKDKKRPKGVGKFLRIRLGGRTQIGEGRRKRHDLESCMCLLPALSVRLERSLLRGMRGKGMFEPSSLMTGVRVQHHCYVQLRDANESPLILEGGICSEEEGESDWRGDG